MSDTTTIPKEEQKGVFKFNLKNEENEDVENKLFDLLLDEDFDKLSVKATEALTEVFKRFDEKNVEKLTIEQMNKFAVAVNGEPFEKDEMNEIMDVFGIEKKTAISLGNFLDFYHLQTSARPFDTMKDLRSLGYDDTLTLCSTSSGSKE